jgi:UrcA family protein
MNKTAFAIAAAIVASNGAAAHAQAVEQAPSIRVSYADLDLSQAAGRATLETRVNRAVNRLCAMPSVANIQAMNSYRACRKSAWTSVRPQLVAAYGRTQFAGVPALAVAAAN